MKQEDEDEEGEEGTETGAVEVHVLKPPLPPHPANLLEVCSIRFSNPISL